MWVWALWACKGDVPTDTGTAVAVPFDPVAVGFAFDGVLRADGTLAGYQVDGQRYEPVMILVFASARYFATGDAEAESCVAVGNYAPAPATTSIATIDGTVLAVSYDTTLTVTGHTCAGRVPAKDWGEDAEAMWGPFDGAHIGYGFSAMTSFLQDAWSPATLAIFGDAMMASWVALDDVDGNWLAADWTTAVVFEWDAVSESPITTLDDEGNLVLVPVDAAAALAAGNLPQGLVQSYPNWYQDFPLIDFDAL